MGHDEMKKAISPDVSQVKSEQQWANRVEEILRQWLLEQPYSTKLAFVLLNGYRLADNRTQAVFREISEKYKAEVIDAAVELPGTLANIEVFLTGVAADILHGEERMVELPGKAESDKSDTAKQASESDEDNSEPAPPEKDKSDKSDTAKPANESDKDNRELVPPDIAEKGEFTPGQPH